MTRSVGYNPLEHASTQQQLAIGVFYCQSGCDVAPHPQTFSARSLSHSKQKTAS